MIITELFCGTPEILHNLSTFHAGAIWALSVLPLVAPTGKQSSKPHAEMKDGQ